MRRPRLIRAPRTGLGDDVSKRHSVSTWPREEGVPAAPLRASKEPGAVLPQFKQPPHAKAVRDRLGIDLPPPLGQQQIECHAASIAE